MCLTRWSLSISNSTQYTESAFRFRVNFSIATSIPNSKADQPRTQVNSKSHFIRVCNVDGGPEKIQHGHWVLGCLKSILGKTTQAWCVLGQARATTVRDCKNPCLGKSRQTNCTTCSGRVVN